MIEMLKDKNPGLKIYSVEDPEFSEYGRILDFGCPDSLSKALAAQPIPENGNHYEASIDELESVECMNYFQETVFDRMPIQAGYCNGHGYTLNAFEYHKCSEVNFSTTGLVLLLALPRYLKDGKIDSSNTVAF